MLIMHSEIIILVIYHLWIEGELREGKGEQV
jgi:hypothetical protein